MFLIEKTSFAEKYRFLLGMDFIQKKYEILPTLENLRQLFLHYLNNTCNLFKLIFYLWSLHYFLRAARCSERR